MKPICPTDFQEHTLECLKHLSEDLEERFGMTFHEFTCILDCMSDYSEMVDFFHEHDISITFDEEDDDH